MHKALHSRDDINRLQVSKKKEEEEKEEDRNIEDSVYASIRAKND